MGSTANPAQGGALSYIAEPLRALALPLESLNLDPANARRHPDKNLDAIKASLQRFGQRMPIVVQKQGMVVRAGNGRVMAAKAIGWTHLACVVVDETNVDAVTFAIADNRTAELAEWDDQTLHDLLKSLPDTGDTGFDDGDVSELVARLAPEVVEDEAPTPLPDPVSIAGDVWLLGGHRLVCGDSTDAGAAAIAMNGCLASVVLTDPPYGVDYKGKTEHALEVKNDDAAGLPSLLRKSLGVAKSVSEPGAVWYVAAPAGPQGLEFALVLKDLGIWRQTLVWVKDSMVLGHSDFHYKHENVYYGWVPGVHREPPTRTCTTVLEFARPKASREHPTMKPIELWAFFLSASSGLKANVYEPFSGSGTTIITCEQLGRRCFAIEIEPRYVDVAVRRWQKITGKEATNEASGKTWRETAADRGVKIDEPCTT